jgi:hypothetical protein
MHYIYAYIHKYTSISICIYTHMYIFMYFMYVSYI